MVDLARKNLLHDKLRFVITVSGVAFAVTLVFVQVGLFLGLLDNASITIEHLDADLWVTSHNTPNVDFAHTFSDNYVQRVRSVPGVARADNLIVWFMTVALPTGAQEGTLVYALEDFPRWKLPWKVLEGNLGDLRRGLHHARSRPQPPRPASRSNNPRSQPPASPEVVTPNHLTTLLLRWWVRHPRGSGGAGWRGWRR